MVSLNPKLINGFHILFVAPLLYAIGTDRFPEHMKKYIAYLGVIVAIVHLMKLVKRIRDEKQATGEGEIEGMAAGDMEIVDGVPVHHIRLYDSSPGYSRPQLRVKVGDVVAWTNVGEVEHTVTANGFEFDSGYMKPGDSFSIRFDKAGTYPYFCQAHRGWMRGIVFVQ